MNIILSFPATGQPNSTTIPIGTAGTLVLELTCPRPLRLWLGGRLVLDESLYWRRFERELRAAVVLPVEAGNLELRIEVGPRPRHPESVDRDCPSRNRQRILAAVAQRLPDQLTATATLHPGVIAPALSLNFLPAQHHHAGITWQHILARPVRGGGELPSTKLYSPADEPLPAIALQTSVEPRHGIEDTSDKEHAAGLRRFHVPIAAPGNEPAPVRGFGVEQRVEPYREITRNLSLIVEGPNGRVPVTLPAFESLGRLAPQREYQPVVWPAAEALRAGVPEPILPAEWQSFRQSYDAAWEMLRRLVRTASPTSGLPNDYISTGTNFPLYQFMWDTSFAAMCVAYGWRVMNPCASLNVLYATQFDGGYIHRELDVRDSTPVLYEPDFSPNPPLLVVAEWQIARLTGNVQRLRQVYPALRAWHTWLQHNRQLPDGTYWTTGLANGLDNSPSLGDGYPDLTAQMAHAAEILAEIATVLGHPADAEEFRRKHTAIGRALNDRLWSETMQIYSTSLPGGGHNPNKVVTAFWPLWAGIVPAERVPALARHLKDPMSFWRHHPLPSLAADSPAFKPEGAYWLGSVWSPTSYAAIKGFDRAGRHDLAVEATIRHLTCVTETLQATGALWENYGSEASVPGSQSAPHYCWSALGPIALLLEVLIGIEADALHDTILWSPPDGKRIGVKNFTLGPATISLLQASNKVEVETDRSFTLKFVRAGQTQRWACPMGRSCFSVG